MAHGVVIIAVNFAGVYFNLRSFMHNIFTQC